MAARQQVLCANATNRDTATAIILHHLQEPRKSAAFRCRRLIHCLLREACDVLLGQGSPPQSRAEIIPSTFASPRSRRTPRAVRGAHASSPTTQAPQRTISNSLKTPVVSDCKSAFRLHDGCTTHCQVNFLRLKNDRIRSVSLRSGRPAPTEKPKNPIGQAGTTSVRKPQRLRRPSA